MQKIHAILISLLLIINCHNPEDKTMLRKNKPHDFTVVYEWSTGSLPPPHYYKIIITLSATGGGKIIMIADYQSNVPNYEKSFAVDTLELEDLYQKLVSSSIFKKTPPRRSTPIVGGELESIDILANGVHYIVPETIAPESKKSFTGIFTIIRKLVPSESWEDIKKFREKQFQQYHQKKDDS